MLQVLAVLILEIMDEKVKVAHKANAHDKGSHASIGRSIMRFSVLFVLTCVLIPVVMLLRDTRDKKSIAVSIWWLKPAESEILKSMLEEVESRDNLQKKISKWAHQQKTASKLYSNIFGRGAFCRNSLNLQALRQHQHYDTKSNPMVWDASIGDRGSTVNIIVSSASRDRSLLSSDGRRESSKSRRNNNEIFLSSTSPLMKRVKCRLYDHRSQLLATVTSLNIVDELLIRCPIPYELRQQATGQDVRLGVKLIWPSAEGGGKDNSVSVRGRGLLTSTGSTKNSQQVEDIRVGSNDVFTQNRSQSFETSHLTTAGAAAGAAAGGGGGKAEGISHTMGKPLYPVCPLAISSRMAYTSAEGWREKILAASSRVERWSTGRIGGGVGKGQGQGGGIRIHGIHGLHGASLPRSRGNEGDVEEYIDQGVVGGGEGVEVGTGRARGGPQLESGECNMIQVI